MHDSLEPGQAPFRTGRAVPFKNPASLTQSALQLSDLEQARALFESALVSQNRGDLIRAELLYRQALCLAPDRPSVMNNLAAVLVRLEKYAEAKYCCDRLVELNPGDESAHLNLGNCQIFLGSPAAAIASYERALAIKPGYAEALYSRGNALLDLNRPQEALASYESALGIKLSEPASSPPRQTAIWRVATHPLECFEAGPSAVVEEKKLFFEPILTNWSSDELAWAARNRIPPLVTKLEHGSVLGLSFLPVTADRKTCLNFFVFNTQNPDKVRGFENIETIPVTGPRYVLARAVGVDEYAEGVLIGNHWNFGHWMLNHLARLALVASVPGLEGIPLVVGENITANQLECLELMGFDESRLVRLRKGHLARFETLWAPMMPFCQVNELVYWVPGIIDFIRQRLGVPRHPASGRRRRRFYLTRQAARWRRVLNESALLDLLAQRGFEVIDPGTLTIRQQLELAADAEVILGPFGASMNFLLFAPDDASVIELKPIANIDMNINPALARRAGQRYSEIIGTPSAAEGVSPINYDFTVSPDRLRDELDAAGVPR